MPENLKLPPVSFKNHWPFWLMFFPVVWVFFVFIHYFAHLGQALPMGMEVFDTHRWPSAEFSDRLPIWGQSFQILVSALFLVGLTWGWGRRLTQWIGLELSDSWVRAAWAFGLGLFFLDSFWLGTGLLGLWSKPFTIAALAGLAVLPLWDGISAFRERQPVSFREFYPKDKSVLVLWALGIFYFLLTLGHDLVPETFYDSMVYHLAIPQYWVLHHGIVDCPSNFFSNYPYGAELYFLNGLWIQGTETAKCLHTAAFFFCALLAGGWAREAGGAKAGWMTFGMVLTLPLFALNTSTTQVEGLLALVLLLFLYALEKALRNEGDLRWALAAGLLGGLALSVKYTAALGMASGFLALGRAAWRKRSLKFWGFLVLLPLLSWGPWLLKNMTFTGNPIFPYALRWFGGRQLPDAGYARLLTEQRAYEVTDWLSWLTLPWRLVMSNPDSYNFAGPLALALLPFLFFYCFQTRTSRYWAWTAGLFFVGGLLITHILRFMVPAFVVLYLLMGVVLTDGERPRWAKGFAALAAVSAFLCYFYFAAISSFYYACAGVWSGRENRVDYLSDRGKITPYAGMAEWISQNLPADTKLLIVGDARGLYYDRPFITNSVFDTQTLAGLAQTEKDADGIDQRLKEMGVTHLVINAQEGIRVGADYHHYDLTPEEWSRLDQFFQTKLKVIYDRNFQYVDELNDAVQSASADRPPLPLLFFTQPGTDFIRDTQRQNWAGVESDAGQVLALDPQSSFWWEQEARAQVQLGERPEAEKSFEKAGHLGILEPDSYRLWAQTARSLGLKAKSNAILKKVGELHT